MRQNNNKPFCSASRIRDAKQQARDMLDKLNGTGKYLGDMGNICYGDGYFASSIKAAFQCDDLYKIAKWADS